MSVSERGGNGWHSEREVVNEDKRDKDGDIGEYMRGREKKGDREEVE